MPKVILDCDPGHDDAVAILLATGHPDVEIHGDMGMEIHRFELPEPRVAPESTHAVRWMIDTLMREEAGSVTVIPTGPLTNLALAARLEPRIVGRVREVVLMGGAFGAGNYTASAEFNIAVDPEAAHIVFGKQWPIVVATELDAERFWVLVESAVRALG